MSFGGDEPWSPEQERAAAEQHRRQSAGGGPRGANHYGGRQSNQGGQRVAGGGSGGGGGQQHFPPPEEENVGAYRRSENWQRNAPTCAEELRKYLSARCNVIKQLYANWDNGFLTDRKLIAGLQAEGVPVCDSLRAKLGARRIQSFQELLQALSAFDEFQGPGSPMKGGGNRGGPQQQYDPSSSPFSEKSGQWSTPGSTVPMSISNPETDDRVIEALRSFLSGSLSQGQLRREFRRLGVEIGADLDRLINRQAAGMSTQFNLYVKALRSQSSSHAPESYASSGGG